MMSLLIHVRYTKSTGVINLSAHNYTSGSKMLPLPVNWRCFRQGYRRTLMTGKTCCLVVIMETQSHHINNFLSCIINQSSLSQHFCSIKTNLWHKLKPDGGNKGVILPAKNLLAAYWNVLFMAPGNRFCCRSLPEGKCLTYLLCISAWSNYII